MPVALEVDAYRIEITRIVEDVFRTMLSLETGISPALETAAGPGSLTAAVQFVGEWNGAVLLQCTALQACQWASRLMPGLHPSRVDEDVRDALGEITNMLGGNLKPILPPGVALSMPSVVEGNDYALHICGGNMAKTWSFSSSMGSFAVTLVQVNGRE
jgi:chemotaxis protein CheX